MKSGAKIDRFGKKMEKVQKNLLNLLSWEKGHEKKILLSNL